MIGSRTRHSLAQFLSLHEIETLARAIAATQEKADSPPYENTNGVLYSIG